MGGTRKHKTSLEQEVLAANTIENYTPIIREEMAHETQTADVFSGIIAQNRPINEFVEGLSLNLRGVVNIGPAGIGKSTAVKELVQSLRDLNAGKAISGPHAEEIRQYHAKLSSKPHGDIIALWNPEDYFAPTIYRSKRQDHCSPLASTLEEQIGEWFVELNKEAMREAQRSAIFEASVRMLSDTYREFMLDFDIPDFFSHVGEYKGKGATKDTTEPTNGGKKEQSLDTRIRARAAELAKTFEKRKVDKAFASLTAKGPAYLQDASSRIDEYGEAYSARVEGIIKKHLEKLRGLGATWRNDEPEIERWYNKVADLLSEKTRIESLQHDVFLYEHILQQKVLTPKEMRDCDIKDIEWQVRVGGKDYTLEALLMPETLYSYDKAGVVIREPTVVSPLELFACSSKKPANTARDLGEEPVHKGITIGELAYADLVVIDDELASMMANNDLRRALLTFLEDGEVRVKLDNVNVVVKNDCDIIANETVNPFYRQVFANEKPTYDRGMRRRFSLVEWPESIEHSEDIVRAFPRVLRQTRAQMSSGAKGFSPEAANLLYQQMLCEQEPHMIVPLDFGTRKADIFERLLLRAGHKGHEYVTPDDVIDFFWSMRDLQHERIVTAESLIDYPSRMPAKVIGHINGLAVFQGEYGAVLRNEATLSGRMGNITSIETKSQLTDKTYNKGMLTTDTWLQSQFGPFSLEMDIRLVDNGVAGNSCTSTQTYAAMSRLGNIPVRQDIFVTGNIADVQGNIGSIGGVYQKARGAMLFVKAYAQRENRDAAPFEVMVPPQNVREILRNAIFDRELSCALESGLMKITTHHNVWEGFSAFSGMQPEKYRKIISDEIRKRQNMAAEHAYLVKGGALQEKQEQAYVMKSRRSRS